MLRTENLLQDNSELYPTVNKYIVYCRKSSESDERQIQSLSDQITTIHNFIASRSLEIVGDPLQESMSAKIPGRPIFNKIIQLIENGQANCIILLNPSRLSRNTVDTGRIIYLMDQGKLQEVLTPYQSFRNNPYDKFMLNLLCTQAKLENDNKSVNIKESLKLKAERGVFPGKARPGYMNNKEKPQGLRDISAHPVYFPLMRKLIDYALTGNYSIEALVGIAGKLGIRSSKSGKPICKSWMHRLLRDPFYTGRFIYGNKLYKGQHPALMTDEEFNLLQEIVDGRAKGRLQKHEFALNGIIKCGECHFTITGEEQTRRYKNGTSQLFRYYRCTKKSTEIKCNQPYTHVEDIENQYINDLECLELDQDAVKIAYEALDIIKVDESKVNKSSFEALNIALEGVEKRLNNLVSLKISPDNTDGSLLSDTEFSERKRKLLIEKDNLLHELKTVNPDNLEWAELADKSFNFSLLAARKFKKGNSETKRLIFSTVGSNPIIIDHKLDFQLRYLFFKYKQGADAMRAQKNPLESKNGLPYQSKPVFSQKSSVWCTAVWLYQTKL